MVRTQLIASGLALCLCSIGVAQIGAGGSSDDPMADDQPLGLDPEAGKAKITGSSLAVGAVVVVGAIALLVMKGLLGSVSTSEDASQAEARCERATAVDPECAEAWALRAALADEANDAETAAYVANGLKEKGHIVDRASDGRIRETARDRSGCARMVRNLIRRP